MGNMNLGSFFFNMEYLDPSNSQFSFPLGGWPGGVWHLLITEDGMYGSLFWLEPLFICLLFGIFPFCSFGIFVYRLDFRAFQVCVE